MAKKSLAQIIEEEMDKVFSPDNPKMIELKKAMDNVNPSARCGCCGKECGTARVICPDCYTVILFGVRRI